MTLLPWRLVAMVFGLRILRLQAGIFLKPDVVDTAVQEGIGSDAHSKLNNRFQSDDQRWYDSMNDAHEKVAESGSVSLLATASYHSQQRVGSKLLTRRVLGKRASEPCTSSTYVVVYVFAGRRDRMSLLLKYLDRLQKLGHVDETHLWNHASSPRDSRWVSRKSNKTTHSGWPMDVWYDAYEYYKPGGAFKGLCDEHGLESTVLVKADDDVVFIDVDTFPALVDYTRSHPEKFLVHANVINNGVAAFYQSLRIPEISSRYPEMSYYPANGTGGFLWSHGEAAAWLHSKFLERPELFAWEDADNDNCIVFQAPNITEGQGRFSINFFAARRQAFEKIAALVKGTRDDEKALTTVATAQGLTECMFTKTSVAHLSFNKQHAKADEALALYEQFWQNL